MKVCVKKASSITFCEVREYKSLDDAVDTILADREAFEHFNQDPLELVVSKPYEGSPEIDKVCDYVVTIYDDWME